MAGRAPLEAGGKPRATVLTDIPESLGFLAFRITKEKFPVVYAMCCGKLRH